MLCPRPHSSCFVTHGCCCANFGCKHAGKHQESQTPGCSSTTSMQSKPFSMNAATYWWKPFALLNAPSTSAYIGGAKLHEKPGGFSLATFCDPLERVLGHSCRSRSLQILLGITGDHSPWPTCQSWFPDQLHQLRLRKLFTSAASASSYSNAARSLADALETCTELHLDFRRSGPSEAARGKKHVSLNILKWSQMPLLARAWKAHEITSNN